MRYEPTMLEHIKNNHYLWPRSNTVERPDPYQFATDVLFINDWLEHNFYREFGDPIELTLNEKVDFCIVLLGIYYKESVTVDGFGKDGELDHLVCLGEWLGYRNELESSFIPNGGDCLLDILEHM